MDALIYTLMSGAERSMRSLQVRANNLANLETPGFRADLERSSTQSVEGYGYDARHLTRLDGQGVSGRAGTLRQTGRELDVAIQGSGYFAVQAGDGEAYTRSGQFNVDAEGQLTLDGRTVLGEGGAITLPPYRAVSVSEDGTVSVQAEGQETMQAVDRLKLVKPELAQLTKNEAGLLVARDGDSLPADETVRVRSGYLEGSNVVAVDEMVATMNLSRDFEIQMKLYKATDEMADAGNRLIRE